MFQSRQIEQSLVLSVALLITEIIRGLTIEKILSLKKERGLDERGLVKKGFLSVSYVGSKKIYNF